MSRSSTLKKSQTGSAGGAIPVPTMVISVAEQQPDRDLKIHTRSDGSIHQNGTLGSKKNENPLQISIPPYQQAQIFSTKPKRRRLLPTNVTIPVGLAQVFIGSSMVICGSLAFRYRSYLFYYGTGLWAGVLTGLAGALAIMCTKKGLPKLRSMCGGDKWQLQVYVGMTMLALTSSILLSIFSTSGLMQDTMYTTEGKEIDSSDDEELFEKRKNTGVAINAILLLLAMLEILLAFCSFGIVLKVVYGGNEQSSSLVSSDSLASQMTVRDILGAGTGPEYEARKDRLFRWLTHQGRNLFLSSSSAASSPRGMKAGSGTHTLVPAYTRQNPGHPHGYHYAGNFMVPHHGIVPHLIAVQPPSSNNTFLPNAPSSRRVLYHRPQPQVLIPHFDSYHMGPPPPMSILMQPPPPPSNLVPICPLIPMQPGRQQHKIGTYEFGVGAGRRRESSELGGARRRRKVGSLHGSMSGGGSLKSHASGVSKRQRKPPNGIVNANGSCRSNSSSSGVRGTGKKNKKPQITEEEIGKTYTGLDKTIAEDFISSTMDKY